MIKIDRLQLDILINGDPARLKMMELSKEAGTLRKEIKSAKDEMEKSVKLDKLREVEDKMEDLRHEIGLAGMTMKELGQRANQVKAILANLKPNTVEFKAYKKELDEVKARQNELRGSTEQTGFSFKRMFEVMGGVAAWNLLKQGFSMIKEGLMNIINSTEEGADQFEFAIAGMRNGVDYFYKTLKTGDWSNFITNMKEAIRAGREYAEVMDDIQDRTRSLTMQEADLRDENNDLEIALKNKTLAENERIKAGQKRIQNEIDMEKKRTDIAQEGYDADIKIAMNRSKLSKTELEDIIKNYDEEKRASANRYNDLLQVQTQIKIASGGVNGLITKFTSANELEQVEKSLAAFPDDIKKYASIIRGEGNLKENMIDNIVKSYVKLKEASTSGKENIKKVITSVNTLLAGEEDNTKKIVKVANDERKKAQELALKSLETTHNQHLNIEKERYAKGEINAKQFNSRIYTLEDTYLEARKRILQSFGQDTTEIETQIADRKVKQAEEIEAAYKKADEEIKKSFDSMQAELDKFFEAQNAEDTKSTEQGFSEQQQADLDRLVELTEWKKQYSVTSLADQITQEEQMLADWHETSKSSEEEYQAALVQLKLKYAAEYTQQAQELVGLYADFVQAQQDAELAGMEANKAKELKAAGDNADKKKAIEEKYQKKELEIKKKYADKQFAAQVAQIIVAGALAIMQAFAQLGPIAGAIATALIVGTTAMQISTANEQRNAVKQLYTGRYNVTGAQDGQSYNNVPYVGIPQTGHYSKPVLIADHGGETVIDATRTRQLMFAYPDVMRFITSLPGPPVKQHADGSYPVVNQQSGNNGDQMVMVLAALSQTVNTLNSKLDNLYAKVNITEFKKAESQYDNLTSDVTQS